MNNQTESLEVLSAQIEVLIREGRFAEADGVFRKLLLMSLSFRSE